jgi:hypothetical protein
MAHLPSQAPSNIKPTQQLEASMTLRCKDGDLAVIVGELPGCEANIGRIVQVRGPAHISEQCGDLLCWVIKPIDRKKMLILYIPDILVSDYVTWKMDIKLPDCWLIPIRQRKTKILL